MEALGALQHPCYPSCFLGITSRRYIRTLVCSEGKIMHTDKRSSGSARSWMPEMGPPRDDSRGPKPLMQVLWELFLVARIGKTFLMISTPGSGSAGRSRIIITRKLTSRHPATSKSMHDGPISVNHHIPLLSTMPNLASRVLSIQLHGVETFDGTDSG